MERKVDNCEGFIHEMETETETETETKTQIFDDVTKPEHYTIGAIECIDAMIAARGWDAVTDFCICNAFKYLWRAGKKANNVEIKDLKKAQWYINKAVELIESNK